MEIHSRFAKHFPSSFFEQTILADRSSRETGDSARFTRTKEKKPSNQLHEIDASNHALHGLAATCWK